MPPIIKTKKKASKTRRNRKSERGFEDFPERQQGQTLEDVSTPSSSRHQKRQRVTRRSGRNVLNARREQNINVQLSVSQTNAVASSAPFFVEEAKNKVASFNISGLGSKDEFDTGKQLQTARSRTYRAMTTISAHITIEVLSTKI